LKKTSKRKYDHIKLGIEESFESKVDPGFKDIQLIHTSLPEINLDEVDVSTRFLKHHLNAPLIIEPITGGIPEASNINRNLAEAAEEIGIAIGVGSQRAALEDTNMINTYSIIREKAPSVPVLANIGCPQLLSEEAEEYIKNAINMLNADALVIHLNPLQESIQPEGQTTFRNVLLKIAEISKKINVPIIVKETGAGISYEIAKALKSTGISVIDVAGLGGTSWAGVEYYRALSLHDSIRKSLGICFWDWGIPTIVSLVEVLECTSLKTIASGGVRNGLDVAKAITLGADLGGLALPLLKAAVKSKKHLLDYLQKMVQEIKLTMFLTGSANIHSLKNKPVVITGKTAEWLTLRGIDISHYARRSFK
jgi:isopentenyl-diphosphate delta-isomerase